MSFHNLTSGAWPGGNAFREKTLRRVPKLAALAVMFTGGIWLWGAASALAKDKVPTTRTVSGVVMDERENFIQGASIELTDLQSKKVLDIYSQKDGQYLFTGLRFDHDYTVQATYNGSYSEVRQVSSIDTRWNMVLNLTILKTNK